MGSRRSPAAKAEAAASTENGGSDAKTRDELAVDIKKQLKTILEQEKSYANKKLVRMIMQKEFLASYQVTEANEYYVMINTQAGVIKVDLRHGPNELYENLEMASDRMRRHGYQIELCEKREDGKGADSYNVTLQRYEEYKVNKKGTANSIDMNIKDGAKQADVVVLRIDVETSMSDLHMALRSRMRRCSNLKEVVIVYKEREYVITQEMLKNGEIIKPED